MKKYFTNAIFVDAACSGNPGIMEYQGIDGQSGKQIFHVGPFTQGTNNLGEFLAIVDALRRIRDHKVDKVIYSDSQTAIARVHSRKIKTTLPYNSQTAPVLDRTQEALVRLQTHNYQTKIEKWQTEIRGEIPADFDRK